MAQIDEKLEAIAKIRMAVDIDVAAHARIDDKAAEARISTKTVHMSAWAAPDNVNGDAPHWIYGSPETPINSHTLETDMCAQGNPSFMEFGDRLRDFLSLCLPDEAIRYKDPILVSLNAHCQ